MQDQPRPNSSVSARRAATSGGASQRHRKLPQGLLGFLSCVFLIVALFRSGATDEERRVSVYSNAATYSLPVRVRDGKDYVGLLELLDPLGAVNAQTEGSRWKIRYNHTTVEFSAGASRARIQGREVDMPSRFLMENGRGLVPVAALGTLLPRILGGPVAFHEASRRVLIGSIAIHFTAQIARRDPPSLVVNFSSPVNPMISTEPGKLRMTFTREAVVAPGSEMLTFDSKDIPSAHYEENNGAATLTVSSNLPLFASFSNGGQTITIAAPPQAPTASAGSAAQPAGGAQPTPPSTTQPAQAAATPPPAPAPPPRVFAVVDAGHGGEERGAALTEQLAEKDVVLAFARSLHQQMESQGLPTLLLRDGDTPLSLDQRATAANRAHPAIYICLHAGSLGTGVRIYTSLIPSGGEDSGPFRDWNTAQASFLTMSRVVSGAVAGELQRRHILARALTAPLRPLNNIATPAIAVEIAPPEIGSADFNSNTYRQEVVGSVVSAVVSLRGQLEAGR